MIASFITPLSCVSLLPAPTHFTVLLVPRQESEYSYMYVLGDYPSISTIFLLDSVSIQTVCIFCFSFYFINNKLLTAR